MMTATRPLNLADYATNDESGFDLSTCTESELDELGLLADRMLSQAQASHRPEELQAAYGLADAVDREICDRE